MGKCDLRVNLGGMEMKNPVMPASGAYDYFEYNADVFPMSRLGAVMVKSVHRNPRPGNPGPRITEVLVPKSTPMILCAAILSIPPLSPDFCSFPVRLRAHSDTRPETEFPHDLPDKAAFLPIPYRHLL